MKVYAIMNQKGGTGKTTTAVNLAATMIEKDLRVLLIDLDPQANATSWMGIKDADKGLFPVLVDDQPLNSVIRSSWLGLDVAPSSNWLVGAEKMLATEIGSEGVIRRKLKELEANRYDVVLIDCPPALGLLSVNALVAADAVVIPVEAHILAVAGLAQLIQTIEGIKRKELNPKLQIAGILPCRVDGRTRHSPEVVEHLKAKFGELIFTQNIRENVKLAECPSFATPITVYDPRSSGAQDYRAFASELIEKEGILHAA
jgi:chromosome partitioning protein